MSFSTSANENPDFISSYRSYTSYTTVPRLYNEWAAILGISSILARQVWIDRGYYKVHPNLYAMLIGDPGTGKGTVCNLIQGVLQNAGYTRFGPNKSTKEKFLCDLEDGFDTDTEGIGSGSDPLTDDFFKSELLTSIETSRITSDVLILAEEISDFFGTDNLDFVTLLTALWSYEGTYKQRIKTGRSVAVPNPCINLLGGATHDSFQQTFPSRLLGTGFLARFVLIYGAIPPDSEIAFPESPEKSGKDKLGKLLSGIKNHVIGQVEISDTEKLVFSKVLDNFSGPSDARFKHYKTRRFVQLLKLTTNFSASNGRLNVVQEDIINANTLLYTTEHEMGKALGEFGKSKNSEIANKIMQELYTAKIPMGFMALFKLVSNDIAKPQELNDMLGNLVGAEKIQLVKYGAGLSGYLATRKAVQQIRPEETEARELINWEYYNYLMGG